jgi:hypothetical protein
VEQDRQQPETARSDQPFRSPDEAAEAADVMRQHASGPLYIVQQAGGEQHGWLVLSADELARHPRASELTPLAKVDPPHAGALSVEVTFTPPGSSDVLSLGTMDPAQAMALLDLLQDAEGLLLRGEDPHSASPDELPPPTGYVIRLDSARPGQLTAHTTYNPRTHHDGHDAHEDLGVPGGDPHSGPASLVVVLDHWAEEHDYRFVHTRAQLNQPIERYLAELAPEDRQRVVIVSEEEDGIVRVGEALTGTMEVFEVAALSTDWLARLPTASG